MLHLYRPERGFLNPCKGSLMGLLCAAGLTMTPQRDAFVCSSCPSVGCGVLAFRVWDSRFTACCSLKGQKVGRGPGFLGFRVLRHLRFKPAG